MFERERQMQPRPTPTSPAPPPAATVTADVVTAPRLRRHDPAIAQRLRHGLLRVPLGRDGAPRW